MVQEAEQTSKFSITAWSCVDPPVTVDSHTKVQWHWKFLHVMDNTSYIVRCSIWYSTKGQAVEPIGLHWILGLYLLSGKTSTGPLSDLRYCFVRRRNGGRQRNQPSGKTFYRQISWRLEAARLGVIMIVSLWNLTGISAALLPRCLLNSRAIGKSPNPNLAASRLHEILR